MSSIRTLAAASVAVLAVACTDARSPTAPPEPEPAAPPPALLAFLEASGPTGLDGFYWMPPIGSNPPQSDAPDGTLLEYLAVEICAWTGSECVGPLVRRITSQSENSARLHLSAEAVYRTVWNTQDDGLETGTFYRIRVLASGGELGHVDVEIIEPSDQRESGQYEHVRLVRGSSLPIGFLIEEGTVQRAGPEGAVIELADGKVTLDVPAGAVSEEVILTATPTTDVPMDGPPIVPGTAFDFGPDGIVFDRPIFMTIAYDPAVLPPGVIESELRIHKVVDGEFQQQNAGLVDLENHTVSAEVDGFSVFVVIERDPDNPEDVVAPDVRSIQVAGPSGAFGDAATLDLSAGDGSVTFRVSITDNITGVGFLDVRWLSPTGRQVRFPCYTSALPTSGSDTNGDWDCQADFPQYAEAGLWRPQYIRVEDRIRNVIYYQSDQPGGFCDFSGTACIESVPQITVVSDPQDITPPVVESFQVSLATVPRAFAPMVSVDASTGPQGIVFGIQATDDLSGVGGGFFFDRFTFTLRGPSNQAQSWTPFCQLADGTTLDGFWECTLSIPGQAETGTWTVDFLRVPDRTGNGGWSGFSDFRPDGTGQLCNPGGTCVTPPTIEIISAGDGEAPFLLAPLSIQLSGSDVVTSPLVTDDVSGVSYVSIWYNSAVSTQYQVCNATLTAGTINAGSWQCTITFPEFAALGQWVVSIQVADRAGNSRYYSRRASDGFLCYFDQAAGTQVCADFGDTDIVLQ
jgi:hypothetical protein